MERGLSQVEMARKMGIDRKTIMHCEMGTQNPNLQMVFGFAITLDVSVSELFDGVDR